MFNVDLILSCYAEGIATIDDLQLFLRKGVLTQAQYDAAVGTPA